MGKSKVARMFTSQFQKEGLEVLMETINAKAAYLAVLCSLQWEITKTTLRLPRHG